MKKLIRILLAAVALLGLILGALELNVYVEKQEYRLEYPALIQQYSREYSLDPYLVAAVIHCESGNRPEAESPKGAVGLMQIMPETGAWIGEKLGVEGFETEMLKAPATNIQMGCWYLNYLLDRFDGNLPHALAAYNAGPGNVSKWLEDPACAQDGVLREIPFEETRNYVERVERAYAVYEELYKGAFA